MQTKTNLNWLFALTICLSLGLPVFAANAPARPDQILEPCIDDQTFAVIHLEMTRLDVDVLVDYAVGQMSKYAGPDVAKHVEAELKNFRTIAGAKLDGLAEAGVRDIFAVFSMYDFPYFFVAVPIPSGSDPARLLQHVQKMAEDFDVGEVETHVTNRFILVGLERTITRLKTVSPARSQALDEGFQACADATAQVVLFPSSDQRRILSEMLPQVPSESGEIQWTALSGDLQWAALGLDGPPSISLDLTIQSASAEGAGRVLTCIKSLYAWAGQYNEFRPLIPQLGQILKRLTPRKQGKRLLLQIDSAAADSLIDDIVAPSLLKARAKARRYSCGSNLKQIGMALLIYANDHKDAFPPDLETLTRAAEMPAKGLICPATGLKESYIYRGASLTTSATPWMITVYETAGNHDGGGRNVLFLDGHVQWVMEERFKELIKKDNEYRLQKKLPILPAQ